MEAILSSLRQDLKQQADKKTAASFSRFFKEPVTGYGVKTELVSKTARQYYQRMRSSSKKEIFTLCDELFRSGYMEEAFVASDWAYALRAQFAPDDFMIFERWVNQYIDNWAKCDTLCNHTVGAFIDRFPHYIQKLKEWARSENRWVKRAAAVTLIIPAREGKFLSDVFEIADILLHDEDDLVQKGYGWLLKEAAKQHEEEVFNYVVSNKNIMPRTALRYAIEKMPQELKRRAMAKD